MIFEHFAAFVVLEIPGFGAVQNRFVHHTVLFSVLHPYSRNVFTLH